MANEMETPTETMNRLRRQHQTATQESARLEGEIVAGLVAGKNVDRLLTAKLRALALIEHIPAAIEEAQRLERDAEARDRRWALTDLERKRETMWEQLQELKASMPSPFSLNPHDRGGTRGT